MIPQLSPLDHPVLDVFLLGFITACSLIAAMFFLRFWRSSAIGRWPEDTGSAPLPIHT